MLDKNNVAVAPPLIQSGRIEDTGFGHGADVASNKFSDKEYSAIESS